MNQQIIDIVTERRREARMVSPDSFTLRPDLKHVWLQRAALWVLAKLGARQVDRVVTYTRHVVDTTDLLTRLAKSCGAVRQSIGGEPTVLLLGAEDFEQIIGSPEEKIRTLVQFDATCKVTSARGVSIMGMRVCIVPWMQGVLPVPAQMLSACVARPAR